MSNQQDHGGGSRSQGSSSLIEQVAGQLPAEELAAAGFAAHVGEPADTAALRGRKRRAKTDRTDARHLRELVDTGRLPECWIPPWRVLECRALLEAYHDLRVERTGVGAAYPRGVVPPGRSRAR